MNEIPEVLVDTALIAEIVNGGALIMMFIIVVLIVWINRPMRRNEISFTMRGNGHDEDDEQSQPD